MRVHSSAEINMSDYMLEEEEEKEEEQSIQLVLRYRYEVLLTSFLTLSTWECVASPLPHHLIVPSTVVILLIFLVEFARAV